MSYVLPLIIAYTFFFILRKYFLNTLIYFEMIWLFYCCLKLYGIGCTLKLNINNYRNSLTHFNNL